MSLPPVLLLLLLPLPLRAGPPREAPEIHGTAAGDAEPDLEKNLLREARELLAADPRAIDALAARLLRSEVAGAFAAEDDPDAPERAGLWLRQNPDAAARLAVGFARDDAEGRREFEGSLTTRVRRLFKLNPNRYAGLLGALEETARDSERLQDEPESGEGERRESLKRLFEGDGAKETEFKEPGSAPSPSGPPETAGAVSASPLPDFLDRLGPKHLDAYSTDVLAFQNQLNRARPPGAPPLKETGRLDYPTLHDPYFFIRYDLDRLWRDFRAQRAWFQARHLGEAARHPARRYDEPDLQKELERRSRGFEEPALAARRAALERAEGALRAFSREAARAKRPGGVTMDLLRALSGRRGEAARWVSLAALEEELPRLGALRGFATPELKERVRRAPAGGRLRALYLKRMETLSADLERTLELKGRARALLLDGSPKALAEASALLDLARRPGLLLPDLLSRCVRAPGKLIELSSEEPRWRRWLGRLALRLAPGSERARAFKRREALRRQALREFQSVAEGR